MRVKDEVKIYINFNNFQNLCIYLKETTSSLVIYLNNLLNNS